MQRRAVSLPILLALAVLSTSLAAHAQTSAHGHWVVDPKGVATPGFIFDTPPSDFNPLTAADTELQDWGLPPRPDTNGAAALDHWTRMVTSTRVTPQLTFTNVVHGPGRNGRIAEPDKNAIAWTFDNWSGYAITQQPGTFYSKNATWVQAYWTVPSVSPPPGYSCSSATYHSSQWVGFDGFTSNSQDVLQAGTETPCGNSDYVWYEWYPYNETRVSDPTTAPGDYMFIQVAYYTVGVPGIAYLYNETTNQNSAVGFRPKPGVTLTGE